MAMGNVTIASDDTSLYVPKQTERTSSDLLDGSRASANLCLRRTKLNEFLVTSGKSTLIE